MTNNEGQILLPALLVAFTAALLSSSIHKLFARFLPFILCLIPLSFFSYFLMKAIALPPNHFWLQSTTWVSELDLDLSFRLDGLSLFFALLISFFAAGIIHYSGTYLRGDRDIGKYYCLLIIFMTAMLGLVLADNLILLFLFWELTTVSSFLLIGFNHDNKDARNSAWQAIIITTFGSLAMLAGFILLGEVAQSYHISTILAQGEVIKEHHLYRPILILILLGAFTKSAQFPFSFWLPAAMTAPTPISAYLHSVTMVKAGIYLLARLFLVLGNTPEWFYSLITLGSLTVLTGSLLVLLQDDLKLILAYLTLISLGIFTILLGLGTFEMISAMFVYLLVHSFYKCSLFLVVGGIDHSTGTRKISELGGLLKKMPFTSMAACLALLSMTGMPPTLGFMAKEMIYKSASVYTSFIIVLAMSATTGVAIYLFLKVFMEPSSTDKEYHELRPLWGPPLLLSLLGIIAVFLIETPFLKSVVSSTTGQVIPGKVFPGVKFDKALGLSALTLIIGYVVYLKRSGITSRLDKIIVRTSFFSPEIYFHKLKYFLISFGEHIERISQRGYYHKYMTVILLTLTLMLALGHWDYISHYVFPEFYKLRIYEWGLILVIITSTISSIVMRSLIASVMFLGVLGFAIAVIFVIYGAPDLALTQLLIETLTIILFALIAIKFPSQKRHHLTVGRTKRDFLLSAVFGSFMTLLLLSITGLPFNQYLSDFYGQNSFELGKGRNVVNVILVDFRALDTLGEITVLTIAGLGFFSLFKLSYRRKKE